MSNMLVINQSDLNEWWREMVKKYGFTVEKGPSEPYDQFGNPYVTLTLGGIKPEGAPIPSISLFENRPNIIDAFETHLLGFLGPRKHIIERSPLSFGEFRTYDLENHLVDRRISIRWRISAYKEDISHG